MSHISSMEAFRRSRSYALRYEAIRPYIHTSTRSKVSFSQRDNESIDVNRFEPTNISYVPTKDAFKHSQSLTPSLKL